MRGARQRDPNSYKKTRVPCTSHSGKQHRAPLGTWAVDGIGSGSTSSRTETIGGATIFSGAGNALAASDCGVARGEGDENLPIFATQKPLSSANSAHMRQSGPESGPDLQVKQLKTFKVFPFRSAAANRRCLQTFPPSARRAGYEVIVST